MTHLAEKRRSKIDPPRDLLLILRCLDRTGLALVLQSIAVAGDLHDVCVMQQPIEQCSGERLIVSYPSNSVSADYPICSECDSEAMEIELIPYEDFISRVSVSDLERTKAWWDAREGLLLNYKRTVLERLDNIIQGRIERDTR